MASRSTARARALALLAVAGLLAGAATAAVPPSAPRGQDTAEPDDGFIRYFGLALHGGGYSGRLYYRGDHCGQFMFGYSLPVRQPVLHAPKEGETGPAAVRAIYREDPATTVSELPDGLISVRMDAVPDTILRTRIARLKLDERERWNPKLAIIAITNATEVKRAMRAHQLYESNSLIKTLLQWPDPDAPHLPATLTGLTMDEALDKVARTFKVIVTYGACEPGLFHVDYAAINAPHGRSAWR